MIFEKLSMFEDLDINNIADLLGNETKAPCSHSRCRSNMMVNPLKLKHMNRIDELEADTLTLNLEDAISPSRKKEALANTALFLSHLGHSSSRIIVRVNPVNEGGEEEIAFLNRFSFDAVRISKVRDPREIERTAELLADGKEIHISVETAEAFRDLGNWGDIDGRFTTAYLGILDLLADLDIPQSILDTGNSTINYILSKFLIDSRTARIRPVSFMFQDYRDTETFRKWCMHERSLGFPGKACMGPAQTKIANEIFGTGRSELEKAEEIIRAFEKYSEKGINGFMHEEYGYIDEPIYKNALNILRNSKKG